MNELKPGWKRVRFDDVVDVITDYWDRDPSKPERFVAGEHIDEGELRVRRWGMTDDKLVPPTFNRRFKAGDVLFHSRNLRKLACPHFDGITGEKLFVLRSRDEGVLFQGLLPFLLQTGAFSEYTERMWAGSTNKFLNKAPLVRYEFALPPIEEQRRTAHLFNVTAEAATALDNARLTAKTVYRSLSASLIPAIVQWPRVALGLLTEPEAPICYGIVKLGEPLTSGIPVLRTENLNGDYTDLYFASAEIDRAYARSRVRGGDVLIAVQGASTGKIGLVPDGFVGNINRHVARVRLGCSMSAGFFLHLWRNPLFAQYAISNAVGSTKPELTMGALRSLKCPCPSLDRQRDICSMLDAAEDCVSQLSNRLVHVRALLRVSIETALGHT